LIVKKVHPSIDMLFFDQAGDYHFITQSAKQNIIALRVSLMLDSMDDAYFPTRGYSGKVVYTRQMNEWGSEAEFSQAYGDIDAAYTFGRHTFLPTLKAGATFETRSFESSQDFSALYTLGGLFNLSGLPTNAISGDQMLFGSLRYQYRLTQDDFFGALSMPLYAGVSVEAGDAWYDKFGQFSDNMDILYAGSIYVSADTIIGPIYLGVGTAKGNYYSVHLSLGQDF